MNWWKLAPRSAEYAPLARMRSDIDRVFDRFFREPFDIDRNSNTDEWLPMLDVKEAENEIVVRAEIPGVAPKDVNVTLSGNTLVISGQKEDFKEEKGDSSYISERRFGAFRRMVPLPEGIDAEKVAAEQDNGVLTVRVGKTKATRPRQIAVKPVAK